jgi:DNA-binding transcriptional MerR regulator
MGQFLKISELAKLMNIFVHQVRYFEGKGILPTAFIDSNGYRMYGMDEIYTLSHILLLRDLQISVPEINQLLNEYNMQQCEGVLRTAADELENKIKELTLTKEKIKRVLVEGEKLKSNIGTFQTQSFSKRRLKKLEVLHVDGSIDLGKLSKNIQYHNQGINEAVYALEQYIDKCNFVRLGPIILIERSYLSIFTKDTVVYEVQTKVLTKEMTR